MIRCIHRASTVVVLALAAALVAGVASGEIYRWVDEKKGLVRIPIDRAIELMVKEAAKAGD